MPLNSIANKSSVQSSVSNEKVYVLLNHSKYSNSRVVRSHCARRTRPTHAPLAPAPSLRRLRELLAALRLARHHGICAGDHLDLADTCAQHTRRERVGDLSRARQGLSLVSPLAGKDGRACSPLAILVVSYKHWARHFSNFLSESSARAGACRRKAKLAAAVAATARRLQV